METIESKGNLTCKFEENNYMTSDEVMECAGLGWNVVDSPVSYTVPTGDMVTDPSFRALVREDTGRLFGVVKSGYQISQNSEAFTLLDSLVDTGQIEYCSAGHFHYGKQVWIQAKVRDSSVFIKGKDQSDLHLLLRTSHDGRGGLSVFPLFTRLWCNNQIRALAKNAAVQVSCSHKPNIGDQIERAQKILRRFIHNFQQWAELGNALDDCIVDPKDLDMMLKYVWPDAEDGKERGQKAKAQIVENFESGTNLEDVQPSDSAWALLQAFTYYTNHQQNVKGPREKTLWFGNASTHNWKALCFLLTYFLGQQNIPKEYRVPLS